MAKETQFGVRYPGLGRDDQELVVRCLRRADINMATAGAVQAVLLSAYTAQFEPPQGELPEGAIKTHLFNPDFKSKRRIQQGRMASHIARFGSQYWFVGDLTQEGLLGLAKITPPRPKDRRLSYFNDIVVRKQDQRNGIATALAHAALKFGSLPQDQPLELDGYAQGDPSNWSPNKWYEQRWGMVAYGFDWTGLVLSTRPDIHIPQIHYRTEAGLTVAGIVQAFEERVPALAGGVYTGLTST